MKTFLCIRICLFAGILFGVVLPNSNAQNCTPGMALGAVESGNIRTILPNDGSLFWNYSGPGFEVPKGSGKQSIFTGGLWFGGLNAADSTLHISVRTYRQHLSDPHTDMFFSGPLNQNGGTTSQTCIDYDVVWHVTKQQIQVHIANYANPGYVMPTGIATWPGPGNSSADATYVPFIDSNNNGLYEPHLGDYPDILGDEAMYTIMNDVPKLPVMGIIGFEVHVMLYGFHNPASIDVQNTIFARYRFVNRGSKTIINTYFAQWLDFALGNGEDNFVGCDTTRNMFYAYNGDNDDEITNNYPNTYGLNPPAQGAIFLNLPLTNFTSFENSSSPTMGRPEAYTEFYNYMRGTWRNGNPLTYGGNGTGGTLPTNFIYNGDPVTGVGWSEVSESNIPGFRSGVGSYGPFTFAPNDAITFDMAFPWARGNSNINSVEELRHSADNLRLFYNNVLSTPNINATTNRTNLSVFPTPTTSHITIEVSNTMSCETTFVLRDLTGRRILQDKVLMPAGQSQHRLALDKLPQGLYLLQVTQGSSSQTVKVLKQ